MLYYTFFKYFLTYSYYLILSQTCSECCIDFQTLLPFCKLYSHFLSTYNTFSFLFAHFLNIYHIFSASMTFSQLTISAPVIILHTFSTIKTLLYTFHISPAFGTLLHTFSASIIILHTFLCNTLWHSFFAFSKTNYKPETMLKLIY